MTAKPLSPVKRTASANSPRRSSCLDGNGTPGLTYGDAVFIIILMIWGLLSAISLTAKEYHL